MQDTDFNPSAELDGTDYHADQTYLSFDFSRHDIREHTFEKCRFLSCRFTNMSLRQVALYSCVFETSELVLVDTNDMTLNSVEFKSTKIMGVNFTACSSFGFLPSFCGCILDSVIFSGNDLKKTGFNNCQIRNCDFGNCDMREASFSGCEFHKSTFQKCNLEKSDFRTASGYEIDPFNNRVRRACFSLPEAQSFLKFLEIRLE